jgi:hypothetical protein
MTAYTGSVIRSTKFGRNQQLEVLAKVAWADAALASGDTLTIADAFPEGVKLGDVYFEMFGTIPDTHATQTSGIKIGTETDDDAFVPATVISQRMQWFLVGTGAAINTADAVITDQRDIVATMTANAATGVTSGTLYFRVIARLITK